jgi:serine/threonine protein kinase
MDFGFSSISRDPSSIPNALDDHGHTPRWTAPEILKPGGASAGAKSDVYSFAMVTYEVKGRTVSEVQAILCVNLGFLRENALP